MTELQRLELRSSEIRGRLNELAGIDGWTDEQRSENDRLTSEYQEVESRRRAALVTQQESVEQTVPLSDRLDPEGRELRSMLQRAELGRIVHGVVERRASDGVERELQQHYGLGDDSIPLALLTEQRADAQTQAPSDVGAQQHPIIPAIFPMSAAAFLGVDMPTVGVGEAVYTVLADGTSASSPAEGAAVDSVAATLTAHTISPARLQVEHEFSLEDKARLAGMSEALRLNLSNALSSAVDKKVIDGLLLASASGGIGDVTDPTAVATYADYRSSVTDQVDGQYAADGGSIRVLLGADTYQHADSLYRGTATDESALEVMMRLAGGLRVSAHVPAVASTIQQGIAARALGAMHAVCPLWEGVRIIYDPYTKSENGLERLVAVMLYGVDVLRASGFTRLKYKLSAA
ncbi:MAG: hypothetical protein F4169_20950 [Gammaproteobacteria bacterium]|nr:hypothetical protein [Gammaproteobacteria bacterium]